MKESEIKTCPYCGSENIEWISDDDCYNEYHWHCHECDSWFDADVCEHEECWHQISALLNGTSIESPLRLGSYVILPCVEKESCGLSDLEKLNVDMVMQIEGEGTMWYHFEGTPDTNDYWYDMSELSTEDLKYLLGELLNL